MKTQTECRSYLLVTIAIAQSTQTKANKCTNRFFIENYERSKHFNQNIIETTLTNTITRLLIQ